jgi:hypothetical protein
LGQYKTSSLVRSLGFQDSEDPGGKQLEAAPVAQDRKLERYSGLVNRLTLELDV